MGGSVARLQCLTLNNNRDGIQGGRVEANFWHERWEKNEIAFHQADTHPLLVEFWPTLGVAAPARVLVPLCGKSLDMLWLLAEGYSVVGVELNRSAVKQFFAEQQVQPSIEQRDGFEVFSAANVEIVVGDIFALQARHVGDIDAVYDRAALVALPETMRSNYSQHICAIVGNAKQLLITFDYDQSLQDGPPFSVDEKEVTDLYAQNYNATLTARVNLEGGLKGKCVADELVWLLEQRVETK